jgi:hypothetical protein
MRVGRQIRGGGRFVEARLPEPQTADPQFYAPLNWDPYPDCIRTHNPMTSIYSFPPTTIVTQYT